MTKSWLFCLFVLILMVFSSNMSLCKSEPIADDLVVYITNLDLHNYLGENIRLFVNINTTIDNKQAYADVYYTVLFNNNILARDNGFHTNFSGNTYISIPTSSWQLLNNSLVQIDIIAYNDSSYGFKNTFITMLAIPDPDNQFPDPIFNFQEEFPIFIYGTMIPIVLLAGNLALIIVIFKKLHRKLRR